MPSATRHRQVFLPLLLVLAALAWAALWGLSLSPYARYLDHGDLLGAGPIAALCSALPAGRWLVPAALSAAAWVLMIAAMMLPTALPLFGAFDRVASDRADRVRLLWLLVLGYVSVWALFGVIAHALHAALLASLEGSSLLASKAWMFGAATIALAGAFQFSALKHHCLDKCRTPLSFVMQHWRGQAQAWHAFVLGARHGAFCVGCCWALMLLMFVVGAGNLGWMLLLAAVMAMEKNLRWGRRLSTPLGVALLAWAALLLLSRGGS